MVRHAISPLSFERMRDEREGLLSQANVTVLLGKTGRGPGGWGGGGTKKYLIRGGSVPRSDPLPFYIPFLAEKVPLSYIFH